LAATKQPSADAAYGLDSRVLALSSLASVLGWIVAAAFGGSEVAKVVCLTIAPWITAFVASSNLSGAVRVRRVALVLLFAGVVKKVRGARRSAPRLPETELAGRGDAAGAPAQPNLGPTSNAVSPTTAHFTHAWLRHVTLTAAISMAPAAAAVVTTHEVSSHNSASAAGPTIHVPPGVLARAGSHTTTHVTYHVTAADHAAKPLLPECRPPSGAPFALGNTSVTCSATDASGRRAEAHFTVTVLRGGHPQPPTNKRPTIAVPRDFTRHATTRNGTHVMYLAKARDARHRALTPDCQPASGSFFVIGPTTVACSATDAAGQTSHSQFTVTVIKTHKPSRSRPRITITVPGPMTVPATSTYGAKVKYNVSATDDHGQPLKVNCQPASDTAFKIRTTTVSCSARDREDNQRTKTFTVTVVRTGKADHSSPTTTTPGQSDTTPAPPPINTTPTPPPNAPSGPSAPTEPPSPVDLTGNWELSFKRKNFGNPEPQPYSITLTESHDWHCTNHSPCYAGIWYNPGRPGYEGELFVWASGNDLGGTTPDSQNGTQEYTGTLVKNDPLTYHGSWTETGTHDPPTWTATFDLTRCSKETPSGIPPGC
jgi:hypothetical protein